VALTARLGRRLEEHLQRILIAIVMLMAIAPCAFAGDLTGEWARVDGEAKVRFSHCGAGKFCGVITWVKDTEGPAKVGQKVFYDMLPSGENTWTGKAFNPEDGKEYAGKTTLAGDSLTTAGCALLGLICESVDWKRAR
jgi:uncharacterized protein (DUF2147 family)